MSKIRQHIPFHLIEMLDAPFSRDDVRGALFEMSPNKSPGPDGFHPVFFQKC